jgi:hypothetical protein
MIDPDLRQALTVLRRGFGHVEPVVHRWQWRTVPFGRCPRCHWPANCLGPDHQPWHAYCWGVRDTPPPEFDQWMRRKVEAGEWGQR